MSAAGEYMRADHQLRSLLFGSGETNSGHVKGEDNRLAVAACLFDMNEAMVELQASLDAAQVLIERQRERMGKL